MGWELDSMDELVEDAAWQAERRRQLRLGTPDERAQIVEEMVADAGRRMRSVERMLEKFEEETAGLNAAQ